MDPLLPDSLVEPAARRFKVLSEPARLELLNQLHVHGEMRVLELVETTGRRQASVSKHLGLMAHEGLVQRRKDGRSVYYTISDPILPALCLLVRGRLREERDG